MIPLMNPADTIREHRRLALLRLLSVSNAASVELLYAALPSMGVPGSLDQTRADVAWLDEAGLVTVEMIGATAIATVTARGLDVAEGRSRTPGVARGAPA